jgi:wobble nucleotide-excising tRNase
VGNTDLRFTKLTKFINEQFKIGNETFKKMESNFNEGCQQLYTYIVNVANTIEEIKASLCTLALKCQDMANAVKTNRSHIIAND